MLGYLFAGRAALFAAKAEEAMQVRLRAGADHPDDVEAGRSIGRRVAALAIARGAADGSDGKRNGNVPEGPGKWKGQNPIAPLAGTWQPWLLASASELRPPAPPAFELRADQGGARRAEGGPAHAENEPSRDLLGGEWRRARTPALERDRAHQAARGRRRAGDRCARARGAQRRDDRRRDRLLGRQVSLRYIRPPQFDAELKTVFAPPNHPSYPAAHGCFSTAAATVLASVLPLDRDRMLALGKEAAEARVWAGIHYRFDIDAGQEIGRKVAEKALQRAFADRAE